MNRKLGWWFSGIITLSCLSAAGQKSTQTVGSSDSPFQRDKYELGLNTSILFSPILPDKGRPTIDYSLSGLHFGWMLTDANSSCWLPGNWELLGEVIGGTPLSGKGSYLAGATVWIRYNFVVPNWKLVPYVQGGGGAELTDFDQRLIGEHFNFNVDAGAGVHYFVKPDLSINVGCHFQHLSNAKLSDTDIGVNAFGPEVGVSYFF